MPPAPRKKASKPKSEESHHIPSAPHAHHAHHEQHVIDGIEPSHDRATEILNQLMHRSTRNAQQAKQSAMIAAGKFFRKKGLVKRILVTGITLWVSFMLVLIGSLLIWIGTLRAPTFDDFTQRKIATSTRIYDHTGKTLLYDVHENIQRTIITFDQISPDIRDGVVAIEDKDFYHHRGIKVDSTIRAIGNTILRKLHLRRGSVQGGSTLTQQVLKNTLLNSKRNISRKIKEWFLALKLEKVLSKDEILTHYLNEAPYGGSVYGIETASEMFFGKKASEVTLAEAAYLAAIPNAPTLFSPYGNHIDRLKARKDLVLLLMKEQGYITDAEYQAAKIEEVIFRPKEDQYAKAIHFVEYVRAYLEEKYGKDIVENEGLEVVTTLDWDLQKEAEIIVKEEALKNAEAWNASNMGLVAIDPTTGHILTMVGSRDYSDADIDGKFNIALAQRQPGSSFKPFIYEAGFEQGYTDATTLFDVPTQFASHCAPGSTLSNGDCYAPKDYDGEYRGPMSVRNALAQSRNIPAVQMLYLVGIDNALATARKMGVHLVGNADTYGLTLVLGGGEVTLLDMTSAYGVFANDGVRNPTVGILKVTDKKGNVLEEYKENPEAVLNPESVRTLNSVLSDNTARSPLFGPTSFLYFGDRYDVAGKTGTTNANRDAWLIGYSPSLAVGVWSGNNDNTVMKKGSSISGPAWRRFMDFALARIPNKRFVPPAEDATKDISLKPILRGVWAGGEAVVIDTISGKLATDRTPIETRKELIKPNPHSILHWVTRGDVRGPMPANPGQDSQYDQWEYGVRAWVAQHGLGPNTQIIGPDTRLPTDEDDVHVPENEPNVSIVTPAHNGSHDAKESLMVTTNIDGRYPTKSIEVFLNDIFIGSSDNRPFSFSFTPSETEAFHEAGEYELKVVAIDQVYNRGEETVSINLI